MPIKLDEHGVARVGGTRVTLDTIVGAFLQGFTAEAIADQYDAVSLADVYAVIAFYLRHREAVFVQAEDGKRDRNDSRGEIEKRFDPVSFRARLLAREQFRG